jgi:hypothetical protein
MHAADAAPVDHLDLEGAHGGAVVRADGCTSFDAWSLVHSGRMMGEEPRIEKAARKAA